MWGNASRDELVDLRTPGQLAVRGRLDRCREPGPVDLRRPRRRELDRFLERLPDSVRESDTPEPPAA